MLDPGRASGLTRQHPAPCPTALVRDQFRWTRIPHLAGSFCPRPIDRCGDVIAASACPFAKPGASPPP